VVGFTPPTIFTTAEIIPDIHCIGGSVGLDSRVKEELECGQSQSEEILGPGYEADGRALQQPWPT
jgi:hypothetical protein